MSITSIMLMIRPGSRRVVPERCDYLKAGDCLYCSSYHGDRKYTFGDSHGLPCIAAAGYLGHDVEV